MSQRFAQRQFRTRHGLSLIEVVFSTLLVGLVLVGALRCVGGVVTGRIASADQARAALLAHALMAEIVTKPYLDEGADPVFGLESTETSNNRANFDDVDDYHGWSHSPPESDGGVNYLGFDGWQRDVTVEWVQPSNPSATVGTDQGLKRITINVSRNGQVLATQVAIRSDKYVDK